MDDSNTSANNTTEVRESEDAPTEDICMKNAVPDEDQPIGTTLILREISKDEQTEELVAHAVKQSVMNFAYASKRKMTREICLDAVSKSGVMLSYVPNRLKDQEVCETAFRQNPEAVLYIPEKYQTKEMWLSAVSSRVRLLAKVPRAFLGEDIYVVAVKQAGDVLKGIPIEQRTARICYEAVSSEGRALQFVPEVKKSVRICKAAVRSDGMALEFVPKGRLDDEIITLALNSNGEALQFLAKNRRTKTRCETALRSNLNAFAFIPESLKTKARCMQAVEHNWSLLAHVPSSEKDDKLCGMAFEQNWRALLFCPEEMLTEELVIRALMRAKEEYDPRAIWPDAFRKQVMVACSLCPFEILDSREVARLERQLGIRKILSKAYDADTREFVVTEKESFVMTEQGKPTDRFSYDRDVEQRFCSFASFFDYVDGDLSGANLLGFDFAGIDVSSIDLSEALVDLSLVDPTFCSKNLYDEIVTTDTYEVADDFAITEVESSSLLHASEIDSFDRSSQRRIFYISDIHLDDCIKNRFPERVSDGEIKKYIAQLVDELVEERINYDEERGLAEILYRRIEAARNNSSLDIRVGGLLLIAGDVSHCFRLSELFFKELARRWNPRDVVVVLGNHELWEFGGKDNTTAEENVGRAVKSYLDLIESLEMHLIQNELLVLSENYNWIKYSEADLFDEDKADEIQLYTSLSSFAVFGGIGFSGLEPTFNANSHMYLNAVSDLESDRRLTARFQNLYKRVVDLFGNKKIVILTHMPYWEWTAKAPEKKWIYVCGHTHHNTYRNDEDLVLFNDNQIGYHRTELSLKHFIMRKRYDMFEAYEDGVYYINGRQYVAFNRGLGINCQFTRGNQITMLKRAGIYMFILEKNGKIYLLEGGVIRNLERQDISYYFERMSEYAEIVKSAAGAYMNAIEKVSEAVKAFGGDGRVHGAIVDIDFFNHIYFNPFDGKMSFYYATSMKDKVFYGDIKKLLAERAPRLLAGYSKMAQTQKDSIAILKSRDEPLSEISNAIKVLDTTMYRPSRVIRTIQHLFDSNIIRVWNEEALAIAASKKAESRMLSQDQALTKDNTDVAFC